MCFVSVVSDHYLGQFGKYGITTTGSGVPAPQQTGPTVKWVIPPENVEELRKLITEFREMMAAARKMDVVMKQPDCVDPEKAKLEARVAELEAKLTAVAEAAR